VSGKNVFLCGPMTGIYAYNVDSFAWAHKMIVDKGAAHVFDPAYEWYTSLVEKCERDDHDKCMAYTISELVKIDGMSQHYYDMVVVLDGWQGSEGASTEVCVARACGIPVYELTEVVDARPR